MRGVAAKASVFLLVTLVPVVARGLPTHKLSTSAVNQDDSVLLWQGVDGVYAQFQASCASCSLHDDYAWPVDLFIGGSCGPCDNTTVFVNGQELSHSWEGRFASGSGSLPSSPSNGSVELQATWQSICVTASLGAPRKNNAHILTVMLDSNDGLRPEDNIGFTISVGGRDEIEILRLSNFPVNLSNGSEWEEWSNHSKDDIELDTDPQPDSSLASLELKLEAELQKLQVLHYELRQLHKSVDLQEKKIHRLLRKDCESLRAKWQQCDTFLCYLKSSWQKLPEFYWSIRYRFGLLGSEKIIPICRSASEDLSNDNPDSNTSTPTSSHRVPSPSTYMIPTLPEKTSLPSSTPSRLSSSPFITTPSLPPKEPDSDSGSDYSHKFPDTSSLDPIVLPVQSQTKHFLRSCAILLLTGLLFWLFFRIIRHSTAFRRRRRDIASRHEELRTRRAYRNAARRLRWRQWWEGWIYSQAQGNASTHSLAEFHYARGVNPAGGGDHDDEGNNANDGPDSVASTSVTEDDDSYEEPPRGMMQAEILGLRRVLEYVGELVGADGTVRRRTRSRSRSGPPPYERVNAAGTININGAARGHNIDSEIHPSATPAISASGGLSSPRASTMFSLETGSLVTLETIDTLDSSGTAPPSYHP